MSERWFVVETKWRAEFQAEEEIAGLGFEVFLPLEFRRRQDRKQKARPIIDYEIPMFPRYLFPRFDISARFGWQEIGRLRSVKRWLKPAQSTTPSPIRSDFIDRVREEQNAIKAARTNDQAIKLGPILAGTRVTILDGPFSAMGGIVSMSTHDRVMVMLDAAGFRGLDLERRFVAAAG